MKIIYDTYLYFDGNKKKEMKIANEIIKAISEDFGYSFIDVSEKNDDRFLFGTIEKIDEDTFLECKKLYKTIIKK